MRQKGSESLRLDIFHVANLNRERETQLYSNLKDNSLHLDFHHLPNLQNNFAYFHKMISDLSVSWK